MNRWWGGACIDTSRVVRGGDWGNRCATGTATSSYFALVVVQSIHLSFVSNTPHYTTSGSNESRCLLPYDSWTSTRGLTGTHDNSGSSVSVCQQPNKQHIDQQTNAGYESVCGWWVRGMDTSADINNTCTYHWFVRALALTIAGAVPVAWTLASGVFIRV